MKFAFFGYDFFAECVETLIRAGWSLEWVQLFEVDEKYNFSSKIRNIASESCSTLRSGKISSDDVEGVFAKGVQIVIVGAYGHRVPSELHSKIPCINIHPSLLPEGRGPWPLPWTILKGHTVSGVTLHLMDSEWDSGPILLQQAFSVDLSENLESLSAKCRITAMQLIGELSVDAENTLKRATRQEGKGSYWRLPSWGERTIDWNDSPEEIDRLCRAFGKFDTLAKIDGRDWIVKDIKLWHCKHDYNHGDTVIKAGSEWVVAVNGGFACIRFFELDPE